MIRLNRIKIPIELKENGKNREILGDTKNDTMAECIYNLILRDGPEEYKFYPVSIDNFNKMIKSLDLPVSLKDYQIEDLLKSLGMPNVFNINKPGYGKTLETILWIRLILKKDFKVLILCPKSVISTWHEQLNKYWPNYLKAGTWWITNYEQLYNKDNFSTAMSFNWDLIVLDESHTIKSMKSKITDIVFKLRSEHRHCLTGTPIKNRPQDLAAQLKWLDPYSITCFTDFQFAFCDMIRDNWGWHPQGLTKNKAMIENLQNLLDLYCVGGQEHNIGSIQSPNYIKVKLKMDDKVKKLYNEVVGEYDKQLEARVIDTEKLLGEGIKVSSAIESAIRRQQLASNPQLFNPQLKNVKFEWIADWLEGTDEKVVIFSKYAQSIQALEIYLKGKKFKVSTVRREQSAQLRKNTIETWKRTNQVLLGTFGVLGTGIDGLQECCNYVIFLDREWTASDNEQAEKRIYRTGQLKQPIIYILQCVGTIDVRIEQVQLDKGHDAKELLDPVIE